MLSGVVLASLVDSTSSGVDIWGVSTDSVSAEQSGYELVVRYPTVTRPALATPFDIQVRREAGFDGPVRIAVAAGWLEMWDYQTFYPTATGATGEPGRVLFTFKAPPGKVLRIFFDARIQPAQQSGRDGFVAVVDDRGTAIAEVSFSTVVLP